MFFFCKTPQPDLYSFIAAGKLLSKPVMENGRKRRNGEPYKFVHFRMMTGNRVEGDKSSYLTVYVYAAPAVEVVYGMRPGSFIQVFGTIKRGHLFNMMSKTEYAMGIGEVVLPVGELCGAIMERRSREKYDNNMISRAAIMNFGGESDKYDVDF